MVNRYAVVKDGTVVNVALSETPIEANWVLAEADTTIGDLYDGTVFSKPSTYPTAEAAILAMVAWIEALHAKITGPVPEDVKFGWKAKADWARAWDAVSNPAVPQMYADEMAAAGLTKYPDTQSFVTRVIAKADIYEGVIADTEGLRGRVQDDLEAESDPAQYEVILNAAMAEAATMAAARGIELAA